MLVRIAGAALLLDQTDTEDGHTLKQLVQKLHDDPEAGPTNMERRAMVALVDAGLVELEGRANRSRYFRVGDPQ